MSLSGRLLVVLQFLLLFDEVSSIPFGTWHGRISSRIITESLLHHFIGEDLKGAHIPPDNWPTLGFTQPGGQLTTLRSDGKGKAVFIKPSTNGNDNIQ